MTAANAFQIGLLIFCVIDCQVHGKQVKGKCGEGEYFDSVVDQCQRCRCSPSWDVPQGCTQYCPTAENKKRHVFIGQQCDWGWYWDDNVEGCDPCAPYCGMYKSSMPDGCKAFCSNYSTDQATSTTPVMTKDHDTEKSSWLKTSVGIAVSVVVGVFCVAGLIATAAVACWWIRKKCCRQEITLRDGLETPQAKHSLLKDEKCCDCKNKGVLEEDQTLANQSETVV
ncbi:uncharacterized protein LOC121384995 [Gigantopelta aegis]|uniref:uncharacterized protein LOC121384995 n=1 Tax=Gigantopelta aegis TaxID=1735272 RepID=UPI001B88E651|nr:uncharacterized protein LOC121384995 [Gigantopelta aegis]